MLVTNFFPAYLIITLPIQVHRYLSVWVCIYPIADILKIKQAEYKICKKTVETVLVSV